MYRTGLPHTHHPTHAASSSTASLRDALLAVTGATSASELEVSVNFDLHRAQHTEALQRKGARTLVACRLKWHTWWRKQACGRSFVVCKLPQALHALGGCCYLPGSCSVLPQNAATFWLKTYPPAQHHTLRPGEPAEVYFLRVAQPEQYEEGLERLSSALAADTAAASSAGGNGGELLQCFMRHGLVPLLVSAAARAPCGLAPAFAAAAREVLGAPNPAGAEAAGQLERELAAALRATPGRQQHSAALYTLLRVVATAPVPAGCKAGSHTVRRRVDYRAGGAGG